MTEAEKKEIVALVMSEISGQAVDFDIATEEPKANDLLTAVRENESGGYKGVTIKWDDVARIATELANQAVKKADQAKTDAVNAKNIAQEILRGVQNKGTEITNFVATSKTEIETQKDESVNAVKSVYQTDLDELKGDLANLENCLEYVLVMPINRLDKTKLEVGKDINSNGDIVDKANRNISGYVNVSDLESVIVYYINGSTVTRGQTFYYALYDENKNKISSGLSAKTNIDVTTAHYIQWGFDNGREEYLMLVDSSLTINQYIPYISPYYKTKRIDDIEKELDSKKYTILSVKLDSSGDFTSLKDCFDSITDASETKRYVVEIYKGIYNIDSYYPDWETNLDSDFHGLFVPDFVTLKGIGNVEEIILQASSTTPRDNVSTLNLRNTASLENITVKATNLRYAVHDDFATKGLDHYERVVKDCIFIGSGSSYGNVYGSGSKNGAEMLFENCKFINEDYDEVTKNDVNGFGNHNNDSWWIPQKLTMKNCRCNANITFASITTNASGILTYATLIGTKLKKLRLKEVSASETGRGNLYKVNGYANIIDSISYEMTDGVDYTSYVDLIN